MKRLLGKGVVGLEMSKTYIYESRFRIGNALEALNK